MNSDEDDEQFEAPRPGRNVGRGGEETSSSGPMGPVYMMWESALEKMKILNYEGLLCKPKNITPFNQVHFVYPGSNASHQFTDFVEICGWLCDQIGGPDMFQREAFDDPNTVVNKLMLALRQLDFRSNFPAQKLKSAHGEPVCSVIEFLCDRVLESNNHRWTQPRHKKEDEMEMGDAPDDEEDEDAIDEENDMGIDEDVLFQEAAGQEVEETSMDNSAHQILHAEVDPVAWKTELERVGPKLRAGASLPTNEWRSHVDQTSASRAKIDAVLTDTSSDLKNLNKDVSDELNKLMTKEKYLNHQFAALSADYREVKVKLEELDSRSGSGNEKLSKLTAELDEITERMDDLKENFESKDSGMHDTSPLVRIKAALQQIKQECQAFDLRIGVVSHSLLVARVASSARKRIGAQQHAKRRRNKKKGRGSDGYGYDDQE